MKSPTQAKLSPLHTHTSYSVLDGASSIDEYIKYCKQNELPGLAVTDHGWMIGALEVWGKCKKAGITGIPGVEFYVAPDTDYQFKGKPYAYYHITAWAVSEAGYRNLIKLGSLSFKDEKIKVLDFVDSDKTKIGVVERNRVITRFGSPKPRITFQELLTHHEGLVLGSGCLIGAINKALLNGETTGAEQNLLKLMEVYQGRIFVELMPHICFEGNTLIDMEDGSQKKIKDIKPGDCVVSYDTKNKKVVSSRVARVHINPSNEGEFIAHNTYGQGLPAQKAPLVCTKDHHFWNGSNWDEIANIERLAVRAKKLSDYELQVITGTMLGDASILKSDAYHYCQAEARMPLVHMVKDFFGGSISKRLFLNKQNQYRLSSRHPIFDGMRRLWYPNGKKCVPKNLRLTPVALAWWYMDDGTLSSRENKYFNSKLSTNGFSKEDVDFLILRLMEDLGVKGSAVKSSDSFVISFDKQQTKILSEKIAPYVDESCKYKLHPDFRNVLLVKPDICQEQDVYPIARKVETHLPDRIRKTATNYDVKYDLEVENTHCYFAEGVLAHNCDHDYSRETKGFIKNPCTDFSPDGDLQHACNLKNIEIARKHDMPLIMTIDSHFTTPDKKTLQDCLLQNGDPDGWRFYNSYHMLSTEEAWEHWSGRYGSDVEQQKIFCEAVENNNIIVELAKDLEIHDPYRLPSPEIPSYIQSIQDVSESEKIKLTIMEQIDSIGRMKWDDQIYQDRLSKEIAVICDNGDLDFGPYFMFLWKWNKWTRDHSILSAPGRGSGAGSLLCYVMGVTHLDPIKWNLPFERFLSAARIARKKYPDIDWDLGDREPLLAILQETYGEKFAQCSTHQVLKVKSAIQDACRVILGWNSNDDRVRDICKTIPITPMGVNDRDFLLGYKDQEGNIHNGHLMQNTVLDNFLKENPKVQEMVFNLLGIPRAVSRHASAYFISNAPIWESVPTASLNGYTVTQYTTSAANNWAEKAGLVKFDFLRINTLSFISSCIRLVQANAGYKVWKEKKTINGEEFELTLGELPITAIPMADGRMLDIYDLPVEPGVFEDLSEGNTESVFQLNSALMTGFTKRIRPSSLQELSDIVALVRPGPLQALIEDGQTTMTEAYIARKNGMQKVTYAHPDMEPILNDTFGVAVYQEQLQQMFIDLAGYTSEDADYLREVLAKKKKQEMEKALPELRQRLQDRGWTEAQQEVFIGLCISSSAYSFNRSHSAAYGSVGYWCAFLKHFFPLEWWTGVLLYAKIDDIKKEYAHCVKQYLELPHVNGSSDVFELKDGKIHAPLYLIDGIGDAAVRAIRIERERAGDFKSMQDFFERIDKRAVNQTTFHQLILCDAFKNVEPNKRPKDLLAEYHYLKKVSSLKLGEGKKGTDLLDAVSKFKKKESEKGVTLDIPILYSNEIELEINRLKALPIYRLDVHHNFKSALEHFGMMIDSGATTYRATANSPTTLVFRNTRQIEAMTEHLGRNIFGWTGLLQESDVFRYTDRRENRQVSALKLYIANDGDVLEAILWPDLKEKYAKAIKDNKIIIVFGTIKASREPGKWSMSIQELRTI